MFITHHDTQFYTVSFGKSPRTILALGGWAGSWEVWAETFSYLSQSWRTIAYDHRGTGATLTPIESISLETMVEDVFVILDALAIENCVLAAESAGVMVALLAALRQPQRFTGLVLVDGLYYRAMPEIEDPFITGLKQNYLATLGAFVDLCVPEPNSEATRRWGRQILERSPQAAAIRLYETIFGVDLRPQVKHISQPTLILHGEADELVPLSDAEWLASEIPNSHLQVIQGAGHVPTVTRPLDLSTAINQFFAKIDS